MRKEDSQFKSVQPSRLLLVTFITLTVAACIFLGAIQYFNRSNTALFQQVETRVQDSTASSELYRLIVQLELNIRELIPVILHRQYMLDRERSRLLKNFNTIIDTAGLTQDNPQRKKLLNGLAGYRNSFDLLMDDYSGINAVFYELNFSFNSMSEQLKLMEQSADQLIVDLDPAGKSRADLQPPFFLIALCRERLLQAQMLINSSITNNNSAVLGANRAPADNDQVSNVIENVRLMTTTLQTLTTADSGISYYAGRLLEAMPGYIDNVQKLSGLLHAFAEHQKKFKNKRDACLSLLSNINGQTTREMLSINGTMREHGRRSSIVAWLISSVVIVVTVLGLFMIRRLSRHLETTAREAVMARNEEEKLNEQLLNEAEERRQVSVELRRARDELEERVKERTAELSDTNRALGLEIEERRHAEYSLAAEKERLSVTLRSIGDGVITTDVTGRVILLNKIAEAMTGWNQDEARGKDLNEVFHIVNETTGTQCDNPVDKVLVSGKIVELANHTVLIDRYGTRRRIADSGAPIRDRNSEVVGVVLVFRDVTEKSRREEEAAKAEKLKSVGILAGGIAHDFNNILAAILGNISLAFLHMDAEDMKGRQLLADAEKASLRARNLTQQLLTFSKGGEPVRRISSIGEVIRDSAGFVLSGGNVRCEYSIPADLWPVNIDAGQMSQVIQNMIINAQHAMPEGGVIEIRCENFVNDRTPQLLLRPGNYIKISIKDSGIGIPSDVVGRIFDPYFTTKEEGSGLGLSLSHSIIRKHDGTITVNSSPGNGSTFSIYIPAEPGREIVEQTIRKEPAPVSGHGRVLVMDDEAMIRDIAQGMLTHFGFEVVTVADGEEAVDLYRRGMETDESFDLVIMDLTIPGGMGGRETIKKLREMDTRVKAIVSSGYSNDPVMAEYKDYGFVGMVNKPFQLEELIDTVNTALKS